MCIYIHTYGVCGYIYIYGNIYIYIYRRSIGFLCAYMDLLWRIYNQAPAGVDQQDFTMTGDVTDTADGFNGKNIYKWWMFTCHVWLPGVHVIVLVRRLLVLISDTLLRSDLNHHN